MPGSIRRIGRTRSVLRLALATALMAVPVAAGAFGPPEAAVQTAGISGGFSWRSRPVANNSDTAEPSIDVDHRGRVYVVAPLAGVQMWRSADKGITFEHEVIEAAAGGGDSDIEFLSDDVGLTADLRLVDSVVSRSTDGFATWDQQSVGIPQDREWLGHFCDKTAYFEYHDLALEAVFMHRSDDAGLTWSEVPTPVSPTGGVPDSNELGILIDQDVNTNPGNIAVDQKTGDVYTAFTISTTERNATNPPFGAAAQVVGAVSHDGGASFELHLLTKDREGTISTHFPWSTVDRAGNVYVVWAGREKTGDPLNVFMTYSTDHGETWASPVTINNDTLGHSHIFPTISAGDAGVVDVAWYTATTPDPSSSRNEWYVDFTQIRNATSASRALSPGRVYPKSIHHGDIARALLDFFEIKIGPDGMANIAFANDATPDGKLRVWYARQTGGSSAGNGLLDSVHCAGAAGAPAPAPSPSGSPPGSGSQPKVLGEQLAGTGVGEASIVAWVLVGAGLGIGARLRFHRD